MRGTTTDEGGAAELVYRTCLENKSAARHREFESHPLRPIFMTNDVQKRIAVGALIFNKKNQLLVVKPIYKDSWLVVGGMVESSESLTEALKREIKEETGLDLKIGRLICVDYGSSDNDSVNFIFECGAVENDIKIICPKNEIEEYKFVSREEALSLLGPKGVRRLTPTFNALDNNTTVYMEASK